MNKSFFLKKEENFKIYWTQNSAWISR